MEERETLFSIADIKDVLSPTHETKHKDEYKEVCSDLEKYYGKAIWVLPFRLGNDRGFDEDKIRRAHEICVKQGKTTFPYLVGVLKKLP